MGSWIDGDSCDAARNKLDHLEGASSAEDAALKLLSRHRLFRSDLWWVEGISKISRNALYLRQSPRGADVIVG